MLGDPIRALTLQKLAYEYVLPGFTFRLAARFFDSFRPYDDRLIPHSLSTLRIS